MSKLPDNWHIASMATSYPQIAVLDTPEGETALLRAIINARPVGMAKHWAMVSILLYLEQILGEGRVTGEEVWNKLRTLYDLDLLDEDVGQSHHCSRQNDQPACSVTRGPILMILHTVRNAITERPEYTK